MHHPLLYLDSLQFVLSHLLKLMATHIKNGDKDVERIKLFVHVYLQTCIHILCGWWFQLSYLLVWRAASLLYNLGLSYFAGLGFFPF